ncbi:regulatory protein RecX [Patescibacteria group bacterium]
MKFYTQGLSYALRLISKKRYTKNQIKQKLIKYFERKKSKEDCNLDQDEFITMILERLQELKYIDDLEYINDYVNQRLKLKPRGIFLIKRELKNKGIEDEDINKYFQDKEIDEYDSAISCLIKKEKQWKKYSHFERKRKAFQHLQSRGFSFESISKAVSKVYKNV